MESTKLSVKLLDIKPFPICPANTTLVPSQLVAGRYGTQEMADLWGPEKTFEFSIYAQAQACKNLSELHPEIIPKEHAEAILKAAKEPVNANHIRELEAKTGHDVIAISQSLEEKLPKEIASHIGKLRTSSDTTETAKALQIKKSFHVLKHSLENLRDIVLEKSVRWMHIPHMDTTHLFDAMPTVLGRPFAHYGEMLQSNLNWMIQVYRNSVYGKWADATGNHHSATDYEIDGLALQAHYCGELELRAMIAPAQTPGLEFQADIFYVLARIGETLNNIAKFIALGKSDDVDIFRGVGKRKGSSAMPHKDAKGGNPTAEEQIMSIRNYLAGNLTTAMMNCEFPYARNLAASANSRINLEDSFKLLDFGIRNLAKVVYELQCNETRCKQRIHRTHGIVVSSRIVNYLTDRRRVAEPLTRTAAHDLVGDLAREAYEQRVDFYTLLIKNSLITTRIPTEVLHKLATAVDYVGESKRIIELVAEKYYQKATILLP